MAVGPAQTDSDGTPLSLQVSGSESSRPPGIMMSAGYPRSPPTGLFKFVCKPLLSGYSLVWCAT